MNNYYFIKLYHEILKDPKMGKMPDNLWRRTIELFLLAGECGRDGFLPPIDDIAWVLRQDVDSLEAELNEIAQLGIISLIDGTWHVTNFESRQEAISDAERSKRYRERKRKITQSGSGNHREVTTRTRNVTEEVTEGVTSRDTDIEVDIDIEKEVEKEKNIKALSNDKAKLSKTNDLDEIFPGPKASEIMPVTTDADSHQLHVDADQHNPLSPVDDIARHWYAGVSKNPSQPLPQDKRKRKKWVKHAGAILAEVGGDVEGLLHAIDHFYFDMQSGDVWTRDNVTEPRNDKLQTAIIAHYNVLEDRRRSYANNGDEDYDLDEPTAEEILFSQVLAFCKTRWPIAYNDLFAPWELIELNGACRVSVPANVKVIFEQRPNMAGVLPEIESEFDMSIELVGK